MVIDFKLSSSKVKLIDFIYSQNAAIFLFLIFFCNPESLLLTTNTAMSDNTGDCGKVVLYEHWCTQCNAAYIIIKNIWVFLLVLSNLFAILSEVILGTILKQESSYSYI